jgi:hypothetical protein
VETSGWVIKPLYLTRRDVFQNAFGIGGRTNESTLAGEMHFCDSVIPSQPGMFARQAVPINRFTLLERRFNTVKAGSPSNNDQENTIPKHLKTSSMLKSSRRAFGEDWCLLTR